MSINFTGGSAEGCGLIQIGDLLEEVSSSTIIIKNNPYVGVMLQLSI
jgi:hypothetical protein